MNLVPTLNPEYIFETSWEVCNKLGGIYTVLSTRANTNQKQLPDRHVFIGPDIWNTTPSQWFIEDPDLFSEWKTHALIQDLVHVRVGRWDIPGKPIVFLVKFDQYETQQSEIYRQMWDEFHVDSMPAYGDYYECTYFSWASARAIESFYRFYQLEINNVIAHFNEWQTGMGALYIKRYLPKVATVFTTHATSIGRSIAGNKLPLYNYLNDYDGDEMAYKLNMVSKHSLEKAASLAVDCLTTVSEITAKECTQFLQRTPEVVTPNGFEKGFIPKGTLFTSARTKARNVLLNLASQMYGQEFGKDTVLVATSGRYEFKNKGIDIFIDALSELRQKDLTKEVVAFLMIPGWMKEPRTDIATSILEQGNYPYTTHWVNEPQNDSITNKLIDLGFDNNNGKVHVILIPTYLNGDDGVLNMDYYDLLIGMDVTVFPSYYEPWGYTPLESVAFSIPTITTSLAGFATWAISQGDKKGIEDGVDIIVRDDENYNEVLSLIAESLSRFVNMDDITIKTIRKNAEALSSKAEWKNFITYYNLAYSKALHNSYLRLSMPCKP